MSYTMSKVFSCGFSCASAWGVQVMSQIVLLQEATHGDRYGGSCYRNLWIEEDSSASFLVCETGNLPYFINHVHGNVEMALP